MVSSIIPIADGNTAFAFVRTGLKEPVLGAFSHEKCSQRRLFMAARFQRNTAPGWAMGINSAIQWRRAARRKWRSSRSPARLSRVEAGALIFGRFT